MASAKSTPIHVYPSATQSQNPIRDENLAAWLKSLGNGVHKASVARIRAEKDKKRRTQLKASTLPAVNISARFQGERQLSNFSEHTGFIALDLDDVQGDPATIKKQLIEQTGAVACWLSVSGTGLWLLFALEGTPPLSASEHYAAWDTCVALVEKTGLATVDRSTRDPTRLSFASSDPDIAFSVGQPVGWAMPEKPPAYQETQSAATYPIWSKDLLDNFLASADAGCDRSSWIALCRAWAEAACTEGGLTLQESKDALLQWSQSAANWESEKDFEGVWRLAGGGEWSAEGGSGRTLTAQAKRLGLDYPRGADRPNQPSKEGNQKKSNAIDWAPLMATDLLEGQQCIYMRGAVHEWDEAVQAYRALEKNEVGALAGEYIEKKGLAGKEAVSCRSATRYVGPMITRQLKRQAPPDKGDDIPMKTGVFNLSEGTMRPYTRRDWYTLDQRGSFDVCTDQDECTLVWGSLFEPFLLEATGSVEVFEFVTDLLAHITFSDNIHQRIIELAGPGGTGKDTFAGLALQLANGLPLSEEGIASRRQDAYVSMIDRRLVQLAEPRILDPLTLKRMSGWSPMVARPLYADEIPFTYRGHIMVWGNLDLDWTAEGMARRLVRLRFDQKPDQPDPRLGQKLTAALPQAFGFLWRHWKQNQALQESFQMPAPVQQWSNQATRAVDSFKTFVEEYIDPTDREAEIGTRDIVLAYAEVMQEQLKVVRGKDGQPVGKELSDRVFRFYQQKVRREATSAGLEKSRHGFWYGSFQNVRPMQAYEQVD